MCLLDPAQTAAKRKFTTCPKSWDLTWPSDRSCSWCWWMLQFFRLSVFLVGFFPQRTGNPNGAIFCTTFLMSEFLFEHFLRGEWIEWSRATVFFLEDQKEIVTFVSFQCCNLWTSSVLKDVTPFLFQQKTWGGKPLVEPLPPLSSYPPRFHRRSATVTRYQLTFKSTFDPDDFDEAWLWITTLLFLMDVVPGIRLCLEKRMGMSYYDRM